jgi:integrase
MNAIKRGNKWQYDFRHEGKRYRKGNFTTKRDAIHAGNEHYNQLSKGVNITHNTPFYEYMTKWLEVYKKPYVSNKTYKDNVRIKDKVEEYFNNTPINKITRTEYQKFLSYYNEKLGQDQLGRINALCKKVVNDAIYEGLIIKNFTFDTTVKSTKEPNKKESEKFLNIDELTSIKKYCKEHLQRLSPTHHLILLMIETGGRYSDCINLKREHIDQVNNIIYLDGTKNVNAARHVDVTKEIIDILLDYANKRPAEFSGFLFTHNGKQITNESVNKMLRHICTELNIKKKITSHVFRHTHASYLIYKDVNIYYISKRLGHSDISITLNKYGHLLKENQEEYKEKTVKLMAEI